MLGVLAYAFYVPELIRSLVEAGLGDEGPVPWFVVPITAAQSGAFVALAVWAGVALAHRVGLRAPAFEAALSAEASVAAALRPQALPGLAVGALGAGLLLASPAFAPAELLAAGEIFQPPLHVRVLYGGITEEILLRWGLMTLFVWLLWRFVQKREGTPRAGYVWAAIGASALLFGAGHLPLAAALTGGLTASVFGYVVLANAAFGVLFGYLFWRYGLEAAILAHALAHALSYALDLL